MEDFTIFEKEVVVILGQIDRSIEEPEKIIAKGNADKIIFELNSMVDQSFFIVSRKFIHPDYHYEIYPVPSILNNKTTPFPLIGSEIPINDVAIVELEESVEVSDSIKPACIATDYNQINTGSGTVVTSGWGSIVECTPYIECELANVLQGTEMFLVSRKICNKHLEEAMPEIQLGDNVLVTDEMICANDHSRVCKGDSGGKYFSYTYLSYSIPVRS